MKTDGTCLRPPHPRLPRVKPPVSGPARAGPGARLPGLRAPGLSAPPHALRGARGCTVRVAARGSAPPCPGAAARAAPHYIKSVHTAVYCVQYLGLRKV